MSIYEDKTTTFILLSNIFSFCLGCSFEANNEEFIAAGENIAIEWEPSTYYLCYLSHREQVIKLIMFVTISLVILLVER